MIVINRDEYNKVTMKVAWGKKTVQRGLLIKEIRPDVFAGYVTFHHEATAGFVWDSRKHDLRGLVGAHRNVPLFKKLLWPPLNRWLNLF